MGIRLARRSGFPLGRGRSRIKDAALPHQSQRSSKNSTSWDSEAFPKNDVLDVGRLLLNYILSAPYVDVALIGMREPWFVELNTTFRMM